MARLLVLVATDPPLAREAIAVALHQVRPDIDTIAVAPDSWPRMWPATIRTWPSAASATARWRRASPSWVLLSGGGSNAAVTSVVGKRRETTTCTLPTSWTLSIARHEPRRSSLS